VSVPQARILDSGSARNDKRANPGNHGFFPLKQGFSGVQKKFKKSQKKACQSLGASLKRRVDATSRAEKPFKKTLKKVKKKLVSAMEV
jgi:hypothetical protein